MLMDKVWERKAGESFNQVLNDHVLLEGMFNLDQIGRRGHLPHCYTPIFVGVPKKIKDILYI
jgi:hypothetical protein